MPNDLRRQRLWAILLALIVVAVYARTLLGQFVWDDEWFVVGNIHVRAWRYVPRLFLESVTSGAGEPSNFYRPLQSLTHAIDIQLWTDSPRGHHFTNVLLQAAAAVAVFLWLAELAPLEGALAGAALWALHPLQVEAVAYISGRGDILGVLFLCLALRFSGTRPFLTFCGVALALLSKESVVTFPALLWLHDRALGRPFSWKRYVPTAALSGVYVVLRLTVLNFKNTADFSTGPNILSHHLLYRLFTYLTTLPEGLRIWLWPNDLHHERQWFAYIHFTEPRVLAGTLFVVAWLGASALLWNLQRRIAVGLLWFVVATFPTSNLVVVINALFFDHWFLLPGLGLALMISQVPFFAGPTRVLTLTTVALLCGSAALFEQQLIDVWHDSITFNAKLLEYSPRNTRVIHNLAAALADRSEPGDLAQSIALYRQAISIGDEAGFHNNLALALEKSGDLAGAEREHRRAVEMDPNLAKAWMTLGLFESDHGRFAEARKAFDHALSLIPKSAELYLSLAQLSLNENDSAGAIAQLVRGLGVVDDPRLHEALTTIQNAHR